MLPIYLSGFFVYNDRVEQNISYFMYDGESKTKKRLGDEI